MIVVIHIQTFRFTLLLYSIYTTQSENQTYHASYADFANDIRKCCRNKQQKYIKINKCSPLFSLWHENNQHILFFVFHILLNLFKKFEFVAFQILPHFFLYILQLIKQFCSYVLIK